MLSLQVRLLGCTEESLRREDVIIIRGVWERETRVLCPPSKAKKEQHTSTYPIDSSERVKFFFVQIASRFVAEKYISWELTLLFLCEERRRLSSFPEFPVFPECVWFLSTDLRIKGRISCRRSFECQCCCFWNTLTNASDSPDCECWLHS